MYDVLSLCFKLVLEFRLVRFVDKARACHAKLTNEEAFGILDDLFCAEASYKILGGTDVLRPVFRDVRECVSWCWRAAAVLTLCFGRNSPMIGVSLFSAHSIGA